MVAAEPAHSLNRPGAATPRDFGVTSARTETRTAAQVMVKGVQPAIPMTPEPTLEKSRMLKRRNPTSMMTKTAAGNCHTRFHSRADTRFRCTPTLKEAARAVRTPRTTITRPLPPISHTVTAEEVPPENPPIEIVPDAEMPPKKAQPITAIVRFGNISRVKGIMDAWSLMMEPATHTHAVTTANTGMNTLVTARNSPRTGRSATGVTST